MGRGGRGGQHFLGARAGLSWGEEGDAASTHHPGEPRWVQLVPACLSLSLTVISIGFCLASFLIRPPALPPMIHRWCVAVLLWKSALSHLEDGLQAEGSMWLRSDRGHLEPQDSGLKCRAGRPSHAFVTVGGILCFGLVPIHVMGPRAMA